MWKIIINIFFLGIRLKERVEPFQPMDKNDSHRRAEEAKKKLNKKICDTLKIPMEKPQLVNSPTEEESMIEVLRRSMGTTVSFKKYILAFLRKKIFKLPF